MPLRESRLSSYGRPGNGAQAAELARRLEPDVVLMDIRMPGLDGVEATRRIAAADELGRVHVLILTTYELDEYVFDSLRAGACGFLLKDTEPTDLLKAIRAAASGDALLSPPVTRQLIAEFATLSQPRRTSSERLAVLTAREREVMRSSRAGSATIRSPRSLC